MNLRRSCVLLLLFGAAVGFGARLDDTALRDSMTAKGPLLGHRWLEKNGLEGYLFRQSWKPTTDSGLACVGRWSYGPSLKVSLRVTADDTVVCLTRGSGASLIRFRSQDSVTLDLLGDVNFAGIPRRAILCDTLVVAGIHSGGTGLEVHGVSNPAQPNLLSRVDLPVVNDIAVKDTMLYVACEDDTLRIYNIANPRLPVLVGFCHDSCDLFMTQAGNYCYLVHVSGVNIVDVSDPANPHRAGHIGGVPLAAYVRDTLCYVTIEQYGLRIYNISNVGSPVPVGSLARPNALDLTMAATCDTTLYTSLLDVISVANPAQPRLVGHVDIPADKEYGVAVVPALDHALVANYTDGVVAVNIRDPATPVFDTSAFGAGITVDIDVDGGKAYLASYFTGLSILDVADPARPVRLGRLDVVGLNPQFCRSVVAKDSFAYSNCWYQLPHLRSVDVSDPSRPVLAGGADITNPPEDMVLRDSLIYVAEQYFFHIVNVARPREPVLVGRCVLPGMSGKLILSDSVAYAATHGVQCVSVAEPDSPVVVGCYGTEVTGLDIVDTVVYGAGPYTGIIALSMANPAAPRLLDSLYLTDTLWWNDVVVVDSLAYVGGERVWVVDVSDAQNLRLVPGVSWTPPYEVRRLFYAPPYLYAACYEAGVCVLETMQVGVGEELSSARLVQRPGTLCPNPTSQCVTVRAGSGLESAVMRDVLGRTVMTFKPGGAAFVVDLAGLQPGLYFIELRYDTGRRTEKLIKQ